MNNEDDKMNHRVFLFDLDATVTKEEILPALSAQVGLTREISELTEKTMREMVFNALKSFGFSYVTIDLAGYRTGSMNKVLKR